MISKSGTLSKYIKWPSLFFTLLKTVKRAFLFRSWRILVWCRANINRGQLDVNKTVWANPSIINLALLRGKGGIMMFYDRGRIKGGDWDEKAIKYEDLDVFQAIRDRFVANKPWDKTEFYHKIVKRIGNGERLWDCRSKSDFDERLRGLENIFADIKANGYKSQADIVNYRGSKYKQVEDEINVYINRNGQLIVGEGVHRLAMAKIAGISRIPIKIAMRHLDWYRFRMEIIDYAKLRLGGKAYHSFTHPDLQDIPSEHGENRFEIIRPHVREGGGGDLLDIGANWGYFCHHFEELGFNCYAVEIHSVNSYFLRKLRDAENRKFKITEVSILTYKGKMSFDVVLALNVFHHFLKDEKSYKQLIDFLLNLKTDLIFFQPHLPSDPQMKGAYINYSCDEFANLVMKYSRLKKYEIIGKDHDERPIYRLYN